MKPSNFKAFPMGSVLQKSEYETVARNIMVILSRTGDIFRPLSWDEYKDERQKDGNFSSGEESFFDVAIDYCKNPDTARLLSPVWEQAYLKAAPSTPVEDKQTELPEWCKQPESCGNSLSKKCICPKPEPNKQPLYKVLNEQRTQGVVTITKTKNHFFLEQSDNNGGFDTLCTFSNVHERQEYNAQYTALAVNNLASLAEALEKINNACIKRFEAYAADAAEKKATPPYILSTLAAISEAAKQALQNIS